MNKEYIDLFFESEVSVGCYHTESKTLFCRWSGYPISAVNFLSSVIHKPRTYMDPKQTHLVLLDPMEGEVIDKARMGNPCSLVFPYYLDNFASVTLITASTNIGSALELLGKESPRFAGVKTVDGNLLTDMLIKSRLFLFPDGYKDSFIPREKPQFDRYFVTLNGVPRYYRAKVIDDLLSNGCEDKMYYSWVLRNNNSSVILGNYKWKTFDPNVSKMLDAVDFAVTYESVPPEYTKAAIDIFIETTCDATYVRDVFITEKTWKPILREKMFLCFNGPDYYKTLKKLGFKLYDKLFDYSFDSIVDHDVRFEKFMQNLIRISKMRLDDVTDLIEQHSDDMYYNKIKAVTMDSNLPDILKPHLHRLPYLHARHEQIKKEDRLMGNIYSKTNEYTRCMTAGQAIVEIGSDRWEGSTEFFAKMAKENNGEFHSVDIVDGAEERLTDALGNELFSNTKFHVNDGSDWSFNYDGPKIHTLYLDNFDWNWRNGDAESIKEYESLRDIYAKNGYQLSNENSIVQHLRQMILLLPHMADDCIVCVDDTLRDHLSKTWSGKGGAVVPFLQANGFQVIDEGAQYTEIGVILARGSYLEQT